MDRGGRRVGASIVPALLLVGVAEVASAQVDFSGEWNVTRQVFDTIHNPYVGEIVGLPLNDEAITRAETYDASIHSLPDWQCRMHSINYMTRSPNDLRIWKEIDPGSRDIVAFGAEWMRSVSTYFFLDARSHPPEIAPHSLGGFSTASWVGNKLRLKTTHLKESWYRRNGVIQSDKAELTQYLTLRQFRGREYLIWTTISYDEVYLTEPLIRSAEYEEDRAQHIPAYPCTVVEEVLYEEEDYVPHYFPGENPQINEFAERYGYPESIIYDGAETMYPEYRLKLREAGVVGPRPDPEAVRH